jgi:flagellar export protein FliJ
VSAKIDRIERLITVRARAAQRAEIEAAALAQALAEAERRVAEARSLWDSSTGAGTTSECSPMDLVAAYEYAISLGRRYDMRLHEARTASANHEAARVRMQAARVALRKLELWRDRVLEQERVDIATVERRDTDEIAAQRRRTA